MAGFTVGEEHEANVRAPHRLASMLGLDRETALRGHAVRKRTPAPTEARSAS